jgi:hypothetical protein
VQLPTTLRTVEHYRRIADKFEELAANLEHEREAEGVPEKLKHFASEIRHNIHSGSLSQH